MFLSDSQWSLYSLEKKNNHHYSGSLFFFFNNNNCSVCISFHLFSGDMEPSDDPPLCTVCPCRRSGLSSLSKAIMFHSWRLFRAFRTFFTSLCSVPSTQRFCSCSRCRKAHGLNSQISLVRRCRFIFYKSSSDGSSDCNSNHGLILMCLFQYGSIVTAHSPGLGNRTLHII